MEEIKKRQELNFKNKKNEFYKRQMSRDMKQLHKRYEILKPEYDENDLYYNINNKNKKVGIKINNFSNIHRKHVNEVKNNFYKKNEKLKIDQNIFIHNLNMVNNDIKNYQIKNNKNIKNNNVIINNNKKINNDYNNESNKNQKQYKYFKDNKLDENKINNVCLDGYFFEQHK